MTTDEAAASVAVRKQQLWDAYTAWQQRTAEADAVADADQPSAERMVAEPPPDLGVPPPPDAPDGEITLEREQQGAA